MPHPFAFFLAKGWETTTAGASHPAQIMDAGHGCGTGSRNPRLLAAEITILPESSRVTQVAQFMRFCTGNRGKSPVLHTVFEVLIPPVEPHPVQKYTYKLCANLGPWAKLRSGLHYIFRVRDIHAG